MADEQGIETGTVETTTGGDTGETQVEQEREERSGEPTLEALQAELANAQSALKRVNAESAKRRKLLEAHEAAETKRKEAELSEVEKAQAAAKEWEEKHQALTAKLNAAQMRQAFYDEADAQKLSFVNPQAKKDAFTLADTSGVATGEGVMTGMPEAVKVLAKSHPHLFGTAQIVAKDINARDTGGGHGKATEAEMAEYAANAGIDVRYLNPELVALAIHRG